MIYQLSSPLIEKPYAYDHPPYLSILYSFRLSILYKIIENAPIVFINMFFDYYLICKVS